MPMRSTLAPTVAHIVRKLVLSATVGVTAMPAFAAGSPVQGDPGTRAVIAALIVAAGLGAIAWIGWDAWRARTVRGRVVGYDRRSGPQGPLDHPIIDYAAAEGAGRLTSTFGMGTTQRQAPWPIGTTVQIRIDGGTPRHHAPLIKAAGVILATVFLAAFVLTAG